MATKLTPYDSLLLKYKPRPIRNDREHRRTLKQVEELIVQHGPNPPRAEGELIAVMSNLIESYEIEATPRRKPTPAETLEHLIESKEVTRAEVARATGIPRSTITNVLTGRRQISKENVARLANYFHVDPSVFLPKGSASLGHDAP
jgi:HTH-type transcriptional regulator/antitoxin HigA